MKRFPSKSIKFIIKGNPLPKVRATQYQNERRNPNVKRCMVHQRVIAAEYMQYKRICQFGPDLVYMKCIFYRSDKRGVDLDNLVKCLADGLKYGNAFNDDKQIRKIKSELLYDKQNPRTEVELMEYIPNLWYIYEGNNG